MLSSESVDDAVNQDKVGVLLDALDNSQNPGRSLLPAESSSVVELVAMEALHSGDAKVSRPLGKVLRYSSSSLSTSSCSTISHPFCKKAR